MLGMGIGFGFGFVIGWVMLGWLIVKMDIME